MMNLVSGAPLRYFHSTNVPPGAYDHLATTAISKFCNMPELEKRLRPVMESMDVSEINRQLRLHPQCGVLTSQDIADHLHPYIHDALAGLVETNFPYPTWQDNHLMPYRQLERACRLANESIDGGDKGLGPVYALLNTYYNFSGDATDGFCVRPTAPDCNCSCASACTERIKRASRLQSLARTYQLCTQLVYSRCSQGPPNDLFWAEPGKTCEGDGTAFVQDYMKQWCQRQMGSMVGDYNASDPRFEPDYVPKHFFRAGGANDKSSMGPGVYVGGEYAPWSAGTIERDDPQEGVFAFNGLAEAAPGMEFRQPRACDPPGVHDLRFRLVRIMQCWRNGSATGDCDPVRLANGTVYVVDGGVDEGDCRLLVRSYPWNRTWTDVVTTQGTGLPKDVHIGTVCVGLVLYSLLIVYFHPASALIL